ncbi:hypothetical protein RB594_006066 [Gaeumannomyces avenae]
MSTEQKELELVDRVDFKILAVANNEKKLQDLLKIYLAPLLLKAKSEHASVRKKVIEICQRLKGYVQAPGVVLPVKALLTQFKSTDNAILRHLDLMFIQIGIGRIEPEERSELVAVLLDGIGTASQSSPALFNLLLRLLPDVKIPPRGTKEDTAFKDEVGLSDPKDAVYVADWLGKFLLLKQTTDDSAGLSKEDIEFLTNGKRDTWTSPHGAKLAETRVRAINFLASGAFKDEERFIPCVLAAANSDGRISSVGEDLLKRSAVSVEDTRHVESLFSAHARLPPPYRTRILTLLTRSAASVDFAREITDVVQIDMGGLGQEPMEIDSGSASVPMVALGLEQTKLHKALFEYLNWVARIGLGRPNFSLGAPLVERLRTFVLEQGWPVPHKAPLSLEQSALRARAYETIGVLARTATLKDDESQALLGFLFRSLAEDPSDVAPSVEGALPGMAHFFALLRPEDLGMVRDILLTYMTTPVGRGPEVVRSARPAAVRCANRYLPLSDVTARWIDILAVAGGRDERSDVVEEGNKGLDPWTYYANDDASPELPDWKEMVHKYFTEIIPHADGAHNRPSDHRGSTFFGNFAGDRLNAYPVTVKYCTRMLLLSALKKDFKIERGWESQLETKIRSDINSRQLVREYLAGVARQPLLELLTAAFEGILEEKPQISVDCAQCFVDVASLAPQAVLKSLAERGRELLPLAMSNRDELRALGARAYGILGAHPANSEAAIAESRKTLQDTARGWKTAVGSDLNAAQGAFLALAHLLSRSAYYSSTYFTATSAADGFGDLHTILPSPDDLPATSPSFQNAIFDTVIQLWTAGFPALPEGESRSKAITSWSDVLSAQAKKGNERAITALGRLPIALTKLEDEEPTLKSILTKLYDLYEIKQAEVHFAVGEAITAAVARWDAEVVQLTLDVEPKDTSYRIAKRSESVSAVLEKLLQDCKSTKPSLLKASGIWLFCLIQHCSHLPEIHSRLREGQAAFMRLLGARDELVQETASRGLSLAYERGDAELRADLVRDLVSAFTGSGPKLKVDQDTELFEAGALPTGEGKSITSYKDIISLANEVGDQSLIYRFMSLATNAATWSTRSAFGRFGLSSILSESEVDPKLYPKLYRYRFDPNPNVQKSMNDIWKALVKDSGAVIDTHFDAILTDLLKSIVGKEWRVREASCAAVADLLSGQKFVKYEKFYKQIWQSAARVVDDVKITVREAAFKLCISLSNTLARHLEEGGGSTSNSSATARSMISEALPFLLSDKGMQSNVKEVQGITIVTLMDMIKHGGEVLRPYIAEIVPAFLNLLSTVEPEAINYHYQRVGESKRDKIDKFRSSLVSSSPLMQAVEDCLRCVDADTMPAVLDRVEQTIKEAIGMPTKIGCGKLLETLSVRHGLVFTPHAARFLKLLRRHILDRNDEVSVSYARAAAYVIRLADDRSKLEFAEYLEGLYFSAEDETRRQRIADAVRAVAEVSPDHFAAVETRLLPLAFVARHDADKYAAAAFTAVWTRHAGGHLTTARYATEIAQLANRGLESPQWALKHGAALAAGDAIRSILKASGSSGQVFLPGLKALWPAMDKGLALKTFDKKEKLLDALGDLAEKGGAFWKGDTALEERIAKIAVREAKRTNDTYRIPAFKALGRVARAHEDMSQYMDRGQEVAAVVLAIAKPHLDAIVEEGTTGGDSMDVDGGNGADRRAREELVAKTAEAALELVATGGCWAPKMRLSPSGALGGVMAALKPYLSASQLAAARRSTWYGLARSLLADAADAADAEAARLPAEDVAVAAGPHAGELARWFAASLDLDLDAGGTGTEAQRTARAEAARGWARALKAGVFGAVAGETSTVAPVVAETAALLRAAAARERSADVREVLGEAIAGLE